MGGDVDLTTQTVAVDQPQRAEYAPISLLQAPAAALTQIPIYLPVENGFALYRCERTEFGESDRERLLANGVQSVFIRVADRRQYHHELEQRLQGFVADPAVSLDQASSVAYEAAVGLVEEVLAEFDLQTHKERLENVSRSVVALVLREQAAFSHLYAASKHDFCTATHMVNVATWMVPLANFMGCTDKDRLSAICKAGLVHDIGKVHIPDTLLNKKEDLSEDEWALIRRHPADGRRDLAKSGETDELILEVTSQHHERLDGSGYPLGLKGDQINPVSNLCSVIDSFDAMTAVRPYMQNPLSVSKALNLLSQGATEHRYDPQVVIGWTKMLAGSLQPADLGTPNEAPAKGGTPRHLRRPLGRTARLKLFKWGDSGWEAEQEIQILARDVSRSGLGFFSSKPVRLGQWVRLYIQGGRGWRREFVDGQIVRCQSVAPGRYDVGMHFGSLPADRPSEGSAAHGSL